ncbi:MAG TPA: TlpA disulfide reductase family protein [Vulgatibacter sp.]|nr:TlpA disulfide reductase family protein [Vulgatibacter sp.]
MKRLLASCLILFALAACRKQPLPEPVSLVLPLAETGAPWSFDSTRGEVTMVFFFATWCIPCQAMEPSVARAAIEGRDEGIRTVGVALDVDGRRTVAPYVGATQPPYPVVVGGGSVARGESPFGRIPELPAVYFLDREGRPAAVVAGVAGSTMLLERAREVRER